MSYKRTGRGHADFDYPVELVWKALSQNSTGNLVDPLSETDYEREPGPGEAYTCALERTVNERMAFEVKTNLYTSTWDVTLTALEPCKTRVSVVESVDFVSFKALALCRLGFGMGAQVHYFLEDVDSKLKNYEKKMKWK